MWERIDHHYYSSQYDKVCTWNFPRKKNQTIYAVVNKLKLPEENCESDKARIFFVQWHPTGNHTSAPIYCKPPLNLFPLLTFRGGDLVSLHSFLRAENGATSYESLMYVTLMASSSSKFILRIPVYCKILNIFRTKKHFSEFRKSIAVAIYI